jgi:hypothetical protein
MRQNAHEVMMQSAALIVGICGSIVMVTGAPVGVAESVISDARAGDVGHDVLLDRDDMLEMHGDQRHYTGNLRNQKQAKKPPAIASFGARRNHFTVSLVTKLDPALTQCNAIVSSRLARVR